MNGKSLKKQYEECYRLERLIQQAIATFDMESKYELLREFHRHLFPARAAAFKSFHLKIGVCLEGHDTNWQPLKKWRDEYRQKAQSQ